MRCSIYATVTGRISTIDLLHVLGYVTISCDIRRNSRDNKYVGTLLNVVHALTSDCLSA